MKFSKTEAQLADSGFTFKGLPTKQQTERFEYCAFDYIKDNPGTQNDQYVSYAGKYFADNGTKSK
jgi:hypothetical protein